MAKPPHHENAVRRYPDEPHPGAATTNGGAIPDRTRTTQQSIPMVIARIDTVPMTADELDNAAEALAVLLNRFLDDHPDLNL
ncbi:hypothetical protein TK50_02820 [Micromonospora haikouensis]|uniref:Uncharacterized protein n=1 Tax=Micromonospora haikouensis TaxID=686309 RepID=A0A0D0VV91_9ACTN|nr:hypothetical protein TK50_02820 [Micromonospora haikouensis]